MVKDIPLRWERLLDKNVISGHAYKAALDIYSDRNDFHHLNAEVTQEYGMLELRAKNCIQDMHTIESDLFGVEFSKGKIVPEKPEYWPSRDSEHVFVNLRQRW